MTTRSPASEPRSMIVPLQDGVRLHELVWDGAADAVPIVLVHGATRTAWTWLSVGRRLAPQHPVVAGDLRGHGVSDAPRDGYDLESLALDVLTIVAANGWGEAVDGPPVLVAGHGFGAMVAAETAIVQPGSVAGVALLDAGWEETAEATRMSPDELLAAIAEPPEVMASMDAYLADRRDFDAGSWDADQETAARAQVDEKHAGHVALITKPSVQRQLVDTMYRYRPAETVAAIDRPLLVLAAGPGTADDEEERERAIALDDLRRMREGRDLPPTIVRRYDGVGHDLMRYRPGDVASELASFAATLQAP